MFIIESHVRGARLAACKLGGMGGAPEWNRLIREAERRHHLAPTTSQRYVRVAAVLTRWNIEMSYFIRLLTPTRASSPSAYPS